MVAAVGTSGFRIRGAAEKCYDMFFDFESCHSYWTGRGLYYGYNDK